MSVPEAVLRNLLGSGGPASRFASQIEQRRVEYDALVTLMLDNASGDRPETPGIAGALAAGCLGDQHLWRDLGLHDRPTLRVLFEEYFPALAMRNDRDMRWKKFLYKCLCRWEGFHVCRAPSCDECSSYEECFSPED
ncbi:MAG TPA: nitrogen fixation protein NifQ [Coriobacteriia bacterium]